MPGVGIQEISGRCGVTGWQLGAMVASTREGLLLFEKLLKYAQQKHHVLITGESGVGKDLVSRAVHCYSARHRRNLISVNCSALPANLIESQLFGHVKGAFTGATSANLGAFGAANGGTLFLDETGELPLELQPKLLRALESNEITSVGASHPREVDVRIVAATNRDLESLVESGEFRADLFYRLQVLELEVSPLRQRRDDICLLVPEILKSIGCKTPFDDSAIRMLQSHDWPGNVRELKNLLIRASIHCPDGVSAGDLAEHLVPKRRTLRAIRNPREQLYQDVSDELRRNGGNQKVTMERLRIPRTTFYRWLKSQKIRQPIDENEVGMR